MPGKDRAKSFIKISWKQLKNRIWILDTEKDEWQPIAFMTKYYYNNVNAAGSIPTGNQPCGSLQLT